MATMQIPIPVANVSDFVEKRASPRRRCRVRLGSRGFLGPLLLGPTRVNSSRRNPSVVFFSKSPTLNHSRDGKLA